VFVLVPVLPVVVENEVIPLRRPTYRAVLPPSLLLEKCHYCQCSVGLLVAKYALAPAVELALEEVLQPSHVPFLFELLADTQYLAYLF
jgi:hypothetical protein